MQISTRGRYGLRSMVDLTLHGSEGPLALRTIADRQGISESYLEQVFNSLRKAGLVKSLRGAQGGYELGRPAKEISVGDILRALEGPIVPVHCVGELTDGQVCPRENFCITRPFWEELKDIVNDFLDKKSLQNLADQARLAMPEEPMYYI
ncbi:MAG TPA: Rrf2 family transcriptional regulator [Bacillota bacterium]|nr:Rrf2 family transcriptional regulator [Bacillota bacterium]